MFPSDFWWRKCKWVNIILLKYQWFYAAGLIMDAKHTVFLFFTPSICEHSAAPAAHVLEGFYVFSLR